jgi:transposase
MKPISHDLRRRVVEGYEEGEFSYAKVANRFRVSESSVKRFVKQWRATGMVAPKPAANGKKPLLDDTGEEGLKGLVERETDLSQEELRAWLAAETDRWVSQPTISRTLQRLRITRKKRRNEPKNSTVQTSRRLASTSRRSGRCHCAG